MEKIIDKFLEHPRENQETYFEHLLAALKIWKETSWISTIILIHAFFPFLFQDSASRRLKKLNEEIEIRKRKCLDESQRCCNPNCRRS